MSNKNLFKILLFGRIICHFKKQNSVRNYNDKYYPLLRVFGQFFKESFSEKTNESLIYDINIL